MLSYLISLLTLNSANHSSLFDSAQPEKLATPSSRKKTKTRPNNFKELAGAEDQPPLTTPITPAPIIAVEQLLCIPVKHENIALLRAMFHSNNGNTRSFSWKHFLQAMVDAGFSVTQSSGSAVGFRNEKGYIVFHRPHPEPVIEPVVLFTMGKRMRRRFGWTAECFIELGEEVEEGGSTA